MHVPGQMAMVPVANIAHEDGSISVIPYHAAKEIVFYPPEEDDGIPC